MAVSSQLSKWSINSPKLVLEKESETTWSPSPIVSWGVAFVLYSLLNILGFFCCPWTLIYSSECQHVVRYSSKKAFLIGSQLTKCPLCPFRQSLMIDSSGPAVTHFLLVLVSSFLSSFVIFFFNHWIWFSAI